MSEATAPPPDASLEEALIEGTVVNYGGCIWIRSASGQSTLPIWPHGTLWDGLNDRAVLPDGQTIPLGATVTAAGGATEMSRVDPPAPGPATPGPESCMHLYPPTETEPTRVWRQMHDIRVIDVPDFTAEPVERVATVLETPEHGPRLCTGPVSRAVPPDCDGPDIVDWFWPAVDYQDNRQGTLWGEYVVAGYPSADGTKFMVSEPVPEAPPADSPATEPTTLPTLPPIATTTASRGTDASTSAPP